ncbi:MAG: DinB family protein [Dehalococcoidia bacterium]
MSPEEERVRNYLLGQGEKYPLKILWLRVIQARLQLIEEISDVNQAQSDFSYDKQEWTISEIVYHVVLSTERVTKLMRELSKGIMEVESDVEPERTESSYGIEELKDMILNGAHSLTAIASELPEYPDTKFTSNHSFFGDLHVGAWYMFQRVHDLDHLNQIRTVKKEDGYSNVEA